MHVVCNVQGAEVAVVAGSGTDPSGRVAYVKTVQPGVVEPASADVQPTAPPIYSEVSRDAGDAGAVKHFVVSADINTDQVCVCVCVCVCVY